MKSVSRNLHNEGIRDCNDQSEKNHRSNLPTLFAKLYCVRCIVTWENVNGKVQKSKYLFIVLMIKAITL